MQINDKGYIVVKRLNKIKYLLLVAVAAFVAVFCIACGGKNTVSKLSITGIPKDGIVTMTDTENTVQLGFETVDGDGSVRWNSGDGDIATIDDSGKVTLIDSGAVVITATLTDNEEITAEALLTVKDERTITDTIILSGMPETNTVQFDEETLQLTATCSNASATLVWISSDETVATVNGNGLVSFVGDGDTDITVYKKGQRAVNATVALTVVRKVENIEIADIESDAVIAGFDYRLEQPYSYELKTVYSPWNASAFELDWSVSDNSIAEIDANGVLTGKQSGKVTVTAKVKGEDVQATKEFDVVKLDEMREDFSYAVANRYIIGTICVDGYTDYTGAKVTAHNADIFVDTYDSEKHMLTVEKNTNFAHWSHVCLGSWDLVPGKYVFTIDMEVTKGEFAGDIIGAHYTTTPAEYEHGLRPNTIGELNFGKLSSLTPKGTQYEIEFELTKSYENFGIMLYDGSNPKQYALNIKSFSLTLADFAVETDVYSDGMLILGEEYTFVPGAIEGCEYSYEFTGNGSLGNEIIELKDGKLTPKKVGDGVKLTVSTEYNGERLVKEYSFSVMENPFTGTADNYEYATDEAEHGYFYDVRRTKYYVRSNNVRITPENGKLKLAKVSDINPWDFVWIDFGKLSKGTYRVTLTLSGDDLVASKFSGYLHNAVFGDGIKTDFSGDKWYAEGARIGTLYDANIKNGNRYTFDVTVTDEDKDSGIAIITSLATHYEFYLEGVDVVALSDIESAEITGIADQATIKSGETKDLTATVAYEGGAQTGQTYECKWSIESNGGSARIIEGDNHKQQLQGLKPGVITLKFTVTSATGKQITREITLTVELGELVIDTTMYSDHILVLGEKYDFNPIPLIDGMTFSYAFKASEGAAEQDASAVVEIANGKLTAKKAGSVIVVVSSEIDGTPISTTIDIEVIDFAEQTKETYDYAVNPETHGYFYDIQRTKYYLRTNNIRIETDTVDSDKALKLTKVNVENGWDFIYILLGDVTKGTYSITFTMSGEDLVASKFGGQLNKYTFTDDFKTNFASNGWSTEGTKIGTLYDNGVKSGNKYTFVFDITEDTVKNFGVAFILNNPNQAYTVWLSEIELAPLSAIADAEMNVSIPNNTMKTGESVDLDETVTYEGGATSGERYTVEWSVENGTGKARIDGSKLIAVAPGTVTLKLTVTGASGKVIAKTKAVTIEVGEIVIETNLYDDNLLVKGEEYKFEPVAFIDGMTFSYAFKANENADETATSDIVTIANGKLVAQKAGSVIVVVKSSIDDYLVSTEIEITVKECGGTEDANYNDAVVVNGHEIRRTNVFIYTCSAITTEVVANGAEKSLKFTHANDWAQDIVFALGDVEAGEYTLTFVMHGDIIANSSWDSGFTCTWYRAKLSDDFATSFKYEKENDNFIIFNAVENKPTPVDGVYTYTIRIAVTEEQKDNFALVLRSNLPAATGWEVYLDSFKFEKLSAIADAEMNVSIPNNTMKTGESVDLGVTVTYENGAEGGESYTVEWSVENGTGNARIDGSKLIAVAPGTVTLKLTVTSASGKMFEKSLPITVEVGTITIDTDMYADGILIKGDVFTFIPEKFTDESEFGYSYSATDIVKVENGKLSALAKGKVTLTVTEKVTGATIPIEIEVVDFDTEETETYDYAVNPETHGYFYDIQRTKYYLRTNNIRIETDTVDSDKALKLTKVNVENGWDFIYILLGDVTKGTYSITFTMSGEDLVASKFGGQLNKYTFTDDFKTNFASNGWSTEGTKIGTLYDNGVKSGNKYTFVFDITEDTVKNFGVAFILNNPNQAYTVWLSEMEFAKLPVVENVQITGIADNATIKTGESVDLGVTVTYEGGATSGESYTVEWSVENGTGKARIDDNTLVAVAPGTVTLKLTVTGANGGTITKTLSFTVAVGEITVNHNLYQDGNIVKGDSYDFVTVPFDDGSVFEYLYSADGIIKVENGKLIALATGEVTLTVTETVTNATKDFTLRVVELSNTQGNYQYATNVVQHGNSYDVERTGVYTRTFGAPITVEDGALKLECAANCRVWFLLGDVKAGTYTVTFKLKAASNSSLGWWGFKGHVYTFTAANDFSTNYEANYWGEGDQAGQIPDNQPIETDGYFHFTVSVTVAQDTSNFGIMLAGFDTESNAYASTVYLGGFEFKLPTEA